MPIGVRAVHSLCVGLALYALAIGASGGLPGPGHLPAVLLIAAAAGAIGYVRERRQRQPLERWAKGQCVACGYDLTDNVSGVCPECGQAA